MCVSLQRSSECIDSKAMEKGKDKNKRGAQAAVELLSSLGQTGRAHSEPPLLYIIDDTVTKNRAITITVADSQPRLLTPKLLLNLASF